MALTPGTLPTNTQFPGSPQGLLNLFAGYLSAPPSKKTVFIQETNSGVPIDRSSVWLDTSTNTLKVYVGNDWSPVAVAPGAITPAMLSSGGPSWDTLGNATISGDIHAADVLAANATLSSALTAVQGNFTGSLTAATIGSAASSSLGASIYYGDGTNLTLPASAPGVPAGTIIYSLNRAIPSGGYLPCMGQNNLSRVGIYSNLYAATCTPATDGYGVALAASSDPIWPGTDNNHFGLPDLRGYFLRVYGTNGNTTIGAVSGAYGTAQNDTLGSHTHTATSTQTKHSHTTSLYCSGNGGNASYYGLWSGGNSNTASYSTDEQTPSVTTTITSTGSTETRPKNYPVYAYVKY